METNNTEISVVNEETGVLASLPTMDVASFQESTFNTPVNWLTGALQRDGKTDTAMHIGNQLKSEDIVGHVLTIVRVGFAHFKDKDDGLIKRVPVLHFKEAPGYWYNAAGVMFKGAIETLCRETNCDIENDMLPELNDAISQLPNAGLRAFFSWKDKRDNSGQRYVNIIFG